MDSNRGIMTFYCFRTRWLPAKIRAVCGRREVTSKDVEVRVAQTQNQAALLQKSIKMSTDPSANSIMLES